MVIDDILIARGKVAPFSRSRTNRTAMGRFGNAMLVNGETFFQLSAQTSEVVRIYVTNTANVRIFNLRIPGARVKWAGSDNGRIEREAIVDRVMISPSERVVLDVLFEQEGVFPLEHHTPQKTYPLGVVNVSPPPVDKSFLKEFSTLRQSEKLQCERAGIESDFVRPPDKTIPVVNFSLNGEQRFTVEQVRERVFQKEPDREDMYVFYCFQHTVGDLRAALPKTRTAILEAINTGINNGQCACARVYGVQPWTDRLRDNSIQAQHVIDRDLGIFIPQRAWAGSETLPGAFLMVVGTILMVPW